MKASARVLCWHGIGVHTYTLVLFPSPLSSVDRTEQSYGRTLTGLGDEFGGLAGLVGAGRRYGSA